MSYFKTIIVTANQPNFAEVAQQAEWALNNYLKYGKAIFIDPKKVAEDPTQKPLPKEKEVEHMCVTQTVLNMTIYHTITLCCEDDEAYGE